MKKEKLIQKIFRITKEQNKKLQKKSTKKLSESALIRQLIDTL